MAGFRFPFRGPAILAALAALSETLLTRLVLFGWVPGRCTVARHPAPTGTLIGTRLWFVRVTSNGWLDGLGVQRTPAPDQS